MKKPITAIFTTFALTLSLILGACGSTEIPQAESLPESSKETTELNDGGLKWWQDTIAYEIYVKSFKNLMVAGTNVRKVTILPRMVS